MKLKDLQRGRLFALVQEGEHSDIYKVDEDKKIMIFMGWSLKSPIATPCPVSIHLPWPSTIITTPQPDIRWNYIQIDPEMNVQLLSWKWFDFFTS